jgi:hypothetical protein
VRSNDERINRLKRLAWLLDSSIPIPGTRLSIGLDALVGLVPFLGDLVGVLASSWILIEAARLGAGTSVLARMALNIALEGVVGTIPLAGDLFDAAWKANQRNVRLLDEWLERPAHAERASGLVVLVVVVTLIAVAALTLLAMLALLRWLVHSAT